MDLSNLNALKVADLKQLLKSRGLSLVGNKSELIQRLESSALNPVGGDSKEIIDEDAILGVDDDANFSKTDDSLLHNEDLLLSETPSIVTNLTTKNSVLSPQKKITPITVKLPEKKEIPNKLNAQTEAVTSQQVAAVVPKPRPLTAEISAPVPIKSNTTNNFQTAEERKQQRLLKFGDPKIKDRAERFGIPIDDPVKSSEGSKIKQRAERFGEVVSTKGKVLVEKERLDKRKERFGAVSATSSSTIIPVSVNADQAILKRQQRFNFVSQTENKPFNGNNSVNSGFKRRRFAF